MSVDFKIIASRQRQDMAESLRDRLRLSDDDIVYDDRPGGGNPYVPTKEAWLKPHDPEATHRVVLNEDVQVCSGFKEICEQLVQSHPDCAFSLFTMELDSGIYDDFISSLNTPYVDHSWALWGCGILMPVSIVEECFRYIDIVFDKDVHESYGILCFLKHKGIPILTTMPVTIQHIGDDSLYDPSLPVRRTRRFSEHPEADWVSRGVARIPEITWFKPLPTNAEKNSDERR